MNKNLINAAVVFAKNEEVNELFFTNDGQCFYKRGPALVHQKEINGAEDGIDVVKREDVAVGSSQSAVDSPEGKKRDAATDEVVPEPKVKSKKKKETE